MSTIDEIQKQGKLIKNALIVCNGSPPPKSLLYQLWEKTTYHVAADGGANLLAKRKYMPDAVVGDFDSLDSKIREKMPNTKFLHIPEQETNDADKSVRHCLKLGFKEIHLLSADGGRLDQFLSGLEILFKYSEQARLVSWTQMERMEFINRDWEETIAPGTILSILPVFGGAQGIVTKGLKYALNDQNLIPGKSPSGVSNLVISNPVSVKIKKGRLLLVIQHKELLN
tara:strand:+ start:582 stop:1262 length:681 start_codon:yes stop_codon:yes gene_type:complete